METRTLNGWMEKLGYKWAPGKEGIYKGSMLISEAQALLADLYVRGEVNRG